MATIKKPAKKMQGGGVMNTKLKDVPGKVKNTVKRAVDKVKNSTIGDVVNVATGGGYSAVKALRKQIGPINDRMPKKKMGGAVKAKNGKSFPDLNKDGKITKADILKGRGVIAQNGTTQKKESLSEKNAREWKEIKARENRIEAAKKEKEKNSHSNARANKVVGRTMKSGGVMKKAGKTPKAQTGNNIKVNPPAGYTKGSGYKSFGKSGVSVKKMQYGGAAASMVPPMMKKGGATKKCKYGCK